MTPHQDAADAWSTAPDEGWADPRGDQGSGWLEVAGSGPGGRGRSNDFDDERFDVAAGLSRPKACASTWSSSCRSTCRPVPSGSSACT